MVAAGINAIADEWRQIANKLCADSPKNHLKKRHTSHN